MVISSGFDDLMGHIIVFEGICSAGKTTALGPILERLPVDLLPEGIRFVTDAPPPPQTSAQALHNDMYFQALDARRWAVAQQYRQREEALLVERCFIGTLSICYGYEPLFGTFVETAKSFIARLQAGEFDPPTAYIWFQASNEAVAQRLARPNARKYRTGPGWTHPDALDRQRRFLQGYFEQVSRVPVYIVDANQQTERVLLQASAHVETILGALPKGYADSLSYRIRFERYLTELSVKRELQEGSGP
jgi:thymidylate kinase